MKVLFYQQFVENTILFCYDNLYADILYVLEKSVAFGNIIVECGRAQDIELQVTEMGFEVSKASI